MIENSQSGASENATSGNGETHTAEHGAEDGIWRVFGSGQLRNTNEKF